MKKGILGDEKFVEEVLVKARLKTKIKIELQDLITLVCKRYCVQAEDLRKPDKSKPVSKIRAILVLLVREVENLTLEELASFLNRESTNLNRCKTLGKYCHQLV